MRENQINEWWKGGGKSEKSINYIKCEEYKTRISKVNKMSLNIVLILSACLSSQVFIFPFIDIQYTVHVHKCTTLFLYTVPSCENTVPLYIHCS